MAASKRKPIPVQVQAEVLFRDGWLCHLCRRPVLYHGALRLAQEVVGARLPGVALAYWNAQWRRDQAPLLDELAASVDHVSPHALGGAHDLSNFAAICARCNARKSTKSVDAFLEEARHWKVKGKHGEPTAWDGLTALFLVLARDHDALLTPTERQWKDVLESRYAELALQRDP